MVPGAPEALYRAKESSGTYTRFQWSTHQALVQHAPGFGGGVGLWLGVVCSST
jgi:hypothetical protein